MQIIAVSFPRIRTKRKKRGGRLGERSSAKRRGYLSVEYHMLPRLGFSPVIFENRYRQSRNPFPHISGTVFSRGSKIDLEIAHRGSWEAVRRSESVTGFARTSQQKREKRLASLAYRVSTSLFFPFSLFSFIYFHLFFFRGGTLFLHGDCRHFDSFKDPNVVAISL